MKKILLNIVFILIFFNIYSQNTIDVDSLYKSARQLIESGDDSAAFLYFQKAAELNHAQAQFYLGLYYFLGIGMPERNYDEALYWFSKSAKQNNGYAQNNIGVMYRNALGVERNDTVAFDWFSKAAKENNVGGLYNLGLCYEEGCGVTQDYDKAMQQYQTAINLKPDSNWGQMEIDEFNMYVAACELKIGFMYENGWGVLQNWNKAWQFYKSAADKNLAQAQVKIGCIYYNGSGNFAKDYQMAYNWFVKASELGEDQAQTLLGNLYMNGWGCIQDYEKAYYWFSRAIDKNNAEAMNNLGVMYMNGWGVKQDYKHAMELYHKSSDKGCAMAQNNIGHMYENGLGVEANTQNALLWYQKAYENGCELAKNNIGILKSKDSQNNGVALPVVADRCIALIIGNADYENGQLHNPKNDAVDLKNKLQQQGVNPVFCLLNGKLTEINNMVDDFCEKAKCYDAAIFYYSGHGFQKDGINYIIPTDAKSKDGNLFVDECVNINNILSKIDESGIAKKIIILDACRTYNAKLSEKGVLAKGLADMQQTTGIPVGTFVLYATSTGNVAEDGVGMRNSPFTSTILKTLNYPNISIRSLAIDVCKEVALLTNHRQIPTYNDNMILKDFFFNIKTSK